MRCDAVIVGGGPAGSVCARELAQAGLAVTLVERVSFPRRKVCGEYLNCGTVMQLQEIGLWQRVKPFINRLRGVTLHVDEIDLRLDFSRVAAGLAREELDSHLLDAARASGVNIVRGRVVDLVRVADQVCGIEFEDAAGRHELRARYTIGADGCGSTVARKLGVTCRITSSARYAMGGHFRHTKRDMLEMHVGKGSYLATNPLRHGRSNVMLVVPRKQIAQAAGHPDEWFKRVAGDFDRSGEPYGSDARLGPYVTVGPLAHYVSTAAQPGVMLVGDAAGFISPFTGQGVYLAIASARAAAKTIVAISARNCACTALLAAYDHEQRRDRQVRSALSRALDILAYAPPLARRLMRRLAQHDALREELLEIFCGLKPPSMLRGARLLVEAGI